MRLIHNMLLLLIILMLMVGMKDYGLGERMCLHGCLFNVSDCCHWFIVFGIDFYNY